MLFQIGTTAFTILQLSLVLEYIAGKTTESLDRLIALYRPDSLVVGSRGRRWHAIGMGIGVGSISRYAFFYFLVHRIYQQPPGSYCLSHSPVPVIVVRPERKVRQTVEKRKADPNRGKHFE